MPVEIRELVIRAVVVDEEGEGESASAPTTPDLDKDALIEECVKQVLKILHRSRER